MSQSSQSSQSSRNSRTSVRLNGKKRFQITGFSAPEKERLASMIKRLGAEYIDDRAFKPQSTHVVCEIPNRSEKFLGACATGKWLVKSSFLYACNQANSWLEEESHEWTAKDIKGPVKHPFLYRAPRKWRNYIRQTDRLAFESWRVILIIDDANMKLVFRRLLEAGGALAVISRLPPTVDSSVTHIFVKTALSYDYLKPWREQGVPCLAPDYIGDFLVEDTVPPLCSRDIFVKKQQQQQSQQKAAPVQQQEQKLPQQKLQQQPASSTKREPKDELEQKSVQNDKPDRPRRASNRNKTLSLERSVILEATPPRTSAISMKSSPSLKQLIIKVERFDSPRSESGSSGKGSNPSTPLSSAKILKNENENRIPNESTKRNLSSSSEAGLQVKVARIGSPQSGSNSDSGNERKSKKDVNNNGNLIGLRRSNRVQRVDYHKLHCGSITPTDEEKKKNLVMTRDKRDDVIDTSLTEVSLHGASLSTSQKRKCSHDDNPKPLKRARRYEDVLHTSDQFCFQRHHARPSSPSLPLSMNVEAMFNTYYEETFYLRALDEFERYVNTQNHPTPEVLWKVMSVLFTSNDRQLSNAVYRSLHRLLVIHPPSTPALVYCYIKSMQFANSAWEFLTVVIDACKGENTDLEGLELSNQIYNNTLLLDFLTQSFSVSLGYCETNEDKLTPVVADVLWTSTDVGELNYRLRHLMSLVIDATVCTDSNNSKFRNLLFSLLVSAFKALQYCCKEKQLNSGKSHIFISELSRKVLPHITHSTHGFKIMDNVFHGLRNTVLGVGLCASILDTLDNIVFMDTVNDISLGKIVGHYLFSIPRGAGRPAGVMTPSKKEIVAPLSKAVVVNINKRNVKGETKLHRACIKGDATMVRQLLNVSGINVNIQDFAGWTALHEACNNGNLECVQLLLDYKPPKTLESYFSLKAKRLTGVDLYLCDPEGTTPLHDAVINHRIEVAKMLVKRGGRKMIEKQNAYGQTPVDLAATDDMMDALIPHDDEETTLNASQIDCSQLSTQSEDLNEIYTQTDSFNCTSVKECRRFLLLFECLLTSFIHVKNLGPDSKDVDEIDQNYLLKMPRYMRKLKRHIERIVVEEGKILEEFEDIFLRLDILGESYSLK